MKLIVAGSRSVDEMVVTYRRVFISMLIVFGILFGCGQNISQSKLAELKKQNEVEWERPWNEHLVLDPPSQVSAYNKNILSLHLYTYDLTVDNVEYTVFWNGAVGRGSAFAVVKK